MGRYALTIILAFSFSILVYSLGNRTINNASNFEVTGEFSTNQAKNIAESASRFLIPKILDTEDDSFIPNTGQTIHNPLNQDQFLPWDAVNGEYRYSIRNQDDTLIVLSSMGRFGSNTYTMEVYFNYASSTWNPDLSKAVFAKDGMELQGSAKIIGHAGTNSTNFQAVKLAWSTQIDGSLVIGPDGDAGTTVLQSNHQDGNVTSGITSLPAPVDHELPDFPDYPEDSLIGSNIMASGGTDPPPFQPSSYDGYYIPVLRVSGDRTITIIVGDTDRTLHVGELDIQQGHVNIIGNGKLTVYAENKIVLNGSSTMNNNRSAETMFTYYKGAAALNFGGSTTWKGGMYAETANITIGGSGGIAGNILTGGSSVNITGAAEANSRIIYAPNATVTLSGSGRIRGAVVANNLVASGAAYVEFSDDLHDTLPDFSSGGEKTLAIRYWR